jgi:hypothetical protein
MCKSANWIGCPLPEISSASSKQENIMLNDGLGLVSYDGLLMPSLTNRSAEFYAEWLVSGIRAHLNESTEGRLFPGAQHVLANNHRAEIAEGLAKVYEQILLKDNFKEGIILALTLLDETDDVNLPILEQLASLCVRIKNTGAVDQLRYLCDIYSAPNTKNAISDP